ncbi:MAG: arsenate reductase (glutaredoxin) [Pseudomonadales bacterium]
MNEAVTIYHNPRCSKSRQTLELLRERGIEPHVVLYLEQPPNAQTLRSALNRLGMTPRQLMRRREAPYRDLNLDDPALTDDALIAAMVEHPVLIERPIVVTDRGVALGRPPENVLDVL